MSAGDLVAVLVAVACLAVVGAATAMVVGMRQTVRRLEAALDELEATVAPAAAEMVETSRRLAAEAERTEGVLDTIDAISARSDAVSKATYKAIAEPVIRTASVLRGTSRATRRLRGRSGEQEEAS